MLIGAVRSRTRVASGPSGSPLESPALHSQWKWISGAATTSADDTSRQ